MLKSLLAHHMTTIVDVYSNIHIHMLLHVNAEIKQRSVLQATLVAYFNIQIEV